MGDDTVASGTPKDLVQIPAEELVLLRQEAELLRACRIQHPSARSVLEDTTHGEDYDSVTLDLVKAVEEFLRANWIITLEERIGGIREAHRYVKDCVQISFVLEPNPIPGRP